MSRDDREIDLISEIEEQARLLGMSGEREADLLGKLGRLESELAAIKNGHGELGKYEQLRLKNSELQAELAAAVWGVIDGGNSREKMLYIHVPYEARGHMMGQPVKVILPAINAAMKGTP
jgi:hypothetical protein